MGDVDIMKVLVSNEISFDEKDYKYFIGYLYIGNKVEPLHIMLPRISAYVKSYDGQTKRMYFLIEDDDLLEKCNTIWGKISADIEKEFDSDPVYNKIFLKNKIKYMTKQPTTKQRHISLNSQFTVVLNDIICFSVQFLDNSLLALKMLFQVFSFERKKLQGFSSNRKIFVSL